MSLIRDVVSSTLNHTIYNSGFIQVPEVQAMAVGAIAIRQGWQLFRSPATSSSNPSLIGRVGRKAAGVALMGAGLTGLGYGMWYGGQSLRGYLFEPSEKCEDMHSAYCREYWQRDDERYFNDHIKGQRVNGSYVPNPCSRRESFCQHGYENSCQKEGLRTSDNLVKVLALGAASRTNYNGAMNMYGCGERRLGRRRYLPTIYESLDSQADVTYRAIWNRDQICEEIQQASKTGPVETLILLAHGSPSSMWLDLNSWFTIFDPLPANCFNGLAPWANIFLMSCSTGAQSLLHPNMAEMISWSSGKEVIAPTKELAPMTVVVNGIQCVAEAEGVGHVVDFGQELTHVCECERFYCPSIHDKSFLKHFNVTSSWGEQALFLSKWIVPTALGVVTVWQTARLGATLLQGGGATINLLADKSSPLLHRLTQKVGLYNPRVASALYGATKGTGHILNRSGQAIHAAMDATLRGATKGTAHILNRSGQAIHAAMDATLRAPVRVANWGLRTVAKIMKA